MRECMRCGKETTPGQAYAITRFSFAEDTQPRPQDIALICPDHGQGLTWKLNLLPETDGMHARVYEVTVTDDGVQIGKFLGQLPMDVLEKDYHNAFEHLESHAAADTSGTDIEPDANSDEPGKHPSTDGDTDPQQDSGDEHLDANAETGDKPSTEDLGFGAGRGTDDRASAGYHPYMGSFGTGTGDRLGGKTPFNEYLHANYGFDQRPSDPWRPKSKAAGSLFGGLYSSGGFGGTSPSELIELAMLIQDLSLAAYILGRPFMIRLRSGKFVRVSLGISGVDILLDNDSADSTGTTEPEPNQEAPKAGDGDSTKSSWYQRLWRW